MLHSSGEKLLMVDADGASRFEDLELLWTAVSKLAPHNEAAVVVGSRAHMVKTDAVVKVCHSICKLRKEYPLTLQVSAHSFAIF